MAYSMSCTKSTSTCLLVVPEGFGSIALRLLADLTGVIIIIISTSVSHPTVRGAGYSRDRATLRVIEYFAKSLRSFEMAMLSSACVTPY